MKEEMSYWKTIRIETKECIPFLDKTKQKLTKIDAEYGLFIPIKIDKLVGQYEVKNFKSQDYYIDDEELLITLYKED